MKEFLDRESIEKRIHLKRKTYHEPELKVLGKMNRVTKGSKLASSDTDIDFTQLPPAPVPGTWLN